MPFKALGLHPSLVQATREMGYTEPTPVQAEAIPIILAGSDLIATAQTGTGKTAAFALPIIQRLGAHGKLRCLILEPTRELALQVEEAFQKFAKFTDLRVTIVYGGVGYGKQTEDLRRGMDILEIQEQQILSNTAYYDGAEFARQVGMLPPRDSGPERAIRNTFNAVTRVRRVVNDRMGS